MKLKRFREKEINKKLVLFSSAIIILSLVFVIFSYSLYQKEDEQLIANGVVGNFGICDYSNGTIWNFDYTENEQEFVVPCDGEYKIETWGAQGGTVNSINNGGFGAYSSGNISLTKNNNLYVYVGGAGSLSSASKGTKGGYNGGGESGFHQSGNYGSGGGATHISFKNELLENQIDKNQLIIVSGGGGGSAIRTNDNVGGYGGNAGGIVGSNGQGYGWEGYGTGGTQTTAGYTINASMYAGGYGSGGSRPQNATSGGGSGYYGGGSGDWVGAGGGSSYIGNPLLTNKSMYCYNCEESSEEATKTVSVSNVSELPISNYAKKGNGYAKITLVKAKYPKKEYKEDILNGADPVIADNLIPVTIEDDGTVKKADKTTEWYDYETKKWANAVILEDTSVSYNIGEVIPENNIESYFVWIPKYSYQLFDLGTYTETISEIPTSSNAKEIQIKFGLTNTSDSNSGECTAPMESGASGNCEVGEYMTHPAFISLGTNGLWVGKFETGYSGATSTANAEVNVNDSTKIIVKPNVYSWRSITVYNSFMVSYDYQRELGSHMMKNTEWGAVALLSHSVYGINKEVNINNNSSYLTGYSAVVGTDQSDYPGTSGTTDDITLPYNTETGYKASTTGNITGVYDISGGTHEYMASYISGNVGESGFDASTITTEEYQKYLDIYNASSSAETYQYRILGDATGEIGPFVVYADGDEYKRYHNNWYADTSSFVDSSYPWFIRGGRYRNGVLAGQLYFYGHTGTIDSHYSFRIVLSN